MADMDRTPEEIEREIAETRMHADRQLDAIEERLSPNRLMQDAVDYLRRDPGGRRLLSDLADTAIRNPVPTTLMALGAGWLVASGYRRRSAPAIAERRPPRAMLPATREHHVHVSDGGSSAAGTDGPSAEDITGTSRSQRSAAESAEAFEEKPTRAETRPAEPAPGVAAVTTGTPAATGAAAVAGKPEETGTGSTTDRESLREEAKRRVADAPKPESHHYHVEMSDPSKPEGTSPSPEETTGSKLSGRSAEESARAFEDEERRGSEGRRAP